MFSWRVFVVALFASAFASAEVHLQKRTPAFCTGEVRRERACLASGGFPFVASLCAEYTPLVTSETTVDSTTTITESATTAVVTEFSTPPATATVYTTSTLNVTRINSSLVTVTSGFSTLYPSNTTTWVTEYSPVYACLATTNVANQKHKRQDASPTTAFGSPTCLSSFVFASGTVGLRSACDCLISAATGTTVISVTNVVVTTTTTSVIGTTHVLPTITATLANSTTRTVTRFVTASTIVPSFATGVRTVTRTTTLTTLVPTATPSSFYLYYNDTASNQTYYGKYQESPSDTGTLISFTSTTPGDRFSLNSGGQLVDISDQSTIAANNTQDIYPLLYLNPSPTPYGSTPVCSTCDNELTCGYLGASSIGEFAVCARQKYLSLGPQGPWAGNGTTSAVDGTCQVINLSIRAVTGPAAYGVGGRGGKLH